MKAVSVAYGRWTAVCYVLPGNTCTQNDTSALGFEALPTFYDLVRSPDTTDAAHSQICFKQKSSGIGVIPASCARSLDRRPDAADIEGGYELYSSTYQARYPPLYYAIVGLPSHLGGSTIELYLMRLVSAALASIFLALALTTARVYSRNSLLVIGLVVATTPMVLYLAGVVNPSGLEIACGVSLFSAGAVLVTERLADAPFGLVAVLVASASTLELVRSLSPLWVALSAISLAAFAKASALRRFLRGPPAILGGLVVVVFGVVAVIWIVTLHATLVYTAGNAGLARGTSEATILRTSFLHNAFYLPDMVGIFGWFDTRAPLFTYLVWYLLALGILALGVVAGGRQRGAALLGMSVAVLVIPVLISSSQARQHGYVWSGRDTLPFAVGVPILAAASAGKRLAVWLAPHRVRRLVVVVALLAGIAQFGAFYEALRRYSVGTAGPIFGFILHPLWRPAIGIVPALVLELAALVALYGLFVASFRATGPDGPAT